MRKTIMTIFGNPSLRCNEVLMTPFQLRNDYLQTSHSLYATRTTRILLLSILKNREIE